MLCNLCVALFIAIRYIMTIGDERVIAFCFCICVHHLTHFTVPTFCCRLSKLLLVLFNDLSTLTLGCSRTPKITCELSNNGACFIYQNRLNKTALLLCHIYILDMKIHTKWYITYIKLHSCKSSVEISYSQSQSHTLFSNTSCVLHYDC